MTKIKYAQVVMKITPAMKTALEEVPRRGGCYNWIFLHQGSMIPYRMLEDPEQFDVINVNMAPADQLLIKELHDKLKNSSTLLIANNDYIAESWCHWQQLPQQYMQLQDLPDAVFGTEPYQTSCLRDDAHCIPHPHWVKMLKHIGNDDLNPKGNKLGVMYHWWEGNTYLPSMVLNRLRREGYKFESEIYGYISPGNDRCKSWTRIMYDRLSPGLTYPDFIRALQTNNFLYEPCHYHTYGRTTVDTAALRIPTVGTDRVWSMRHCFPNMSCDPVDTRTTLDIMRHILKQDSWLDEQMDYAYDAVEFFNYKNSKDRYMKMIDDTRKKVSK